MFEKQKEGGLEERNLREVLSIHISHRIDTPFSILWIFEE